MDEEKIEEQKYKFFDNIYEKYGVTKFQLFNNYFCGGEISYNAKNKTYVSKDFYHPNFTKKQINANYLTIINNTLIEHISFQYKDTQIISSLIKNNLPYYFLNKIEDLNIIIGHQQLEYIDQFINIIKNKNKTDKLEMYKKNNIQKCIQWCEKYKIPCNKLLNKTNIFLHPYNENETNEHAIDEIIDEENTLILLLNV